MNLERRRNTYSIASLVALIVVFIVCQCVLSGCKSKEDSGPSSDAAGELRLRLETDFSRSEYSLGETVVIRLYLKNTTDKDIVCAWQSKEEKIYTHYENNKPIVYRDTILFYKPVSKEKSFVTIKAGAERHFGTSEIGEETSKDGGKYFDKEGRWELKIIDFYDFTGERFGLNAWQGKLTSDVLSINILPRSAKTQEDKKQ